MTGLQWIYYNRKQFRYWFIKVSFGNILLVFLILKRQFKDVL